MKHKPNYKFLNRVEVKGLSKIFEKDTSNNTEEKVKEFKQKNDGNYYAAIMGNDEVIFCSKLEINGKELWIPEPNPVHIYFYGAYGIVDKLEQSKLDFEKMAAQLKDSSTIETYPYLLNFFLHASQYFFFAFTSIESFINQSIPEDFQYQSKKKGQINKAEIEKGIVFQPKLLDLKRFDK